MPEPTSKRPRRYPPLSGMPRKPKNTSHGARATDGTFSSSRAAPDGDPSDASAAGTDDETTWESDWEEGDAEPEPWESLPTPWTYDERMARKDQKRANAEAKRRAVGTGMHLLKSLDERHVRIQHR
ncbi:hypothetical protein B0H14DRAFT_2585326 [Mycena olivaceomarginata]|nr:hypothetical protein B0H14DRAFT_2585326 [Mycena olivaceomarginata]